MKFLDFIRPLIVRIFTINCCLNALYFRISRCLELKQNKTSVQSNISHDLYFNFQSEKSVKVLLYIYIYNYEWRNWNIKLEITMTRKSGTHQHTKHWSAVSTLLRLISTAHRVLHHWRSNQQPQYVEAETLPLSHWFMPPINDAELTSLSELRDHLTKCVFFL